MVLHRTKASTLGILRRIATTLRFAVDVQIGVVRTQVWRLCHYGVTGDGPTVRLAPLFASCALVSLVGVSLGRVPPRSTMADDAGDDDVMPADGGAARARLVRDAVRTLVDALGGNDARLEKLVLAWEQALARDRVKLEHPSQQRASQLHQGG